MAADLLLEIEGGEGPHPEPIAALPEVIGLSAFNDVFGDLPMIGIDPFGMASPAQCLQAADMGAHISLGVLALAFEVVTDALQVPTRPIDAVVSAALAAMLRSAGLGPETTEAASTIMSRPTSSILLESLNSM